MCKINVSLIKYTPNRENKINSYKFNKNLFENRHFPASLRNNRRLCIFIGEHIITREFLSLSLLPVEDDTAEQREEERGTDIEDRDS